MIDWVWLNVKHASFQLWVLVSLSRCICFRKLPLQMFPSEVHVSSPGVSPTLQPWHVFVKDLGNLSWNIDIGEDSSSSLRVYRRWGDWLQQTQMTQPQRKLLPTSGSTQCVPQMPSVRLSAEVLKGVSTTSPQGLHTTTPIPKQVHAPLLFRWITEKPYLKKEEGKNKEIKKEKKFLDRK